MRGLPLIIVALAGLLMGMAAASAYASRPNESTALARNVAAPAPGVALGPHTNDRIEALKAELVRVTEYERAYGCHQLGRFGQVELCGASKARVDGLHEQIVRELRALEQRDADAIDQVTKRIRELTGDPTRTVTFHGTSSNPYTNSGKRIEHYRDAQGLEFWIDPRGNNGNNVVVQFGPGPNATIEFARSGTLTVAELRQRAEQFLHRHVDGFEGVQARYTYRQTAKPGGSSYAFRWEASNRPAGEDLAPFVQAVLSPAGEVMSFSDTRTLYVKG